MRLTTTEMAAHLGLAPFSGTQAQEALLTVAVTDNREAKPGALFVCVPGSRVDGHDYATQAVAQGASAVLASRPLSTLSVPVLQVPDTVKALGAIAALWRSKTLARVVGITGTAGKTTLKEALAQTLAQRGKTARNALNNNNQIGMPRAVLATDGDEDFWVMEAGISHENDMDELAPVLRPDLGLILNVGAGHTEGLGKKGVAWHKARLLMHLAENGHGLVSADYPDLVREARAVCPNVLFFSATGRAVPYRGAYAGPAPAVNGQAPRGLYRLWLDGVYCDVNTPFMGEFGTENSIAVAAAAHLLGLTPDEIARGLACAQLPAQRFTPLKVGAWDVIDDTYNANPLSMRRMLDAAADLSSGRPLVTMLGQMGELGEQAADEHEILGRHLAELKPAAVFWKGGHAADVRMGLDHGGYTGPWLPVDDAADFMAAWQALQRELSLDEQRGGVLLFKGSRSNKLEELLSVFTSAKHDNSGEQGHAV